MKHHEKAAEFDVDQTLTEADRQQLDALLLPGGYADTLRVQHRAQEWFVKWSVRRKPIAGICHAPWLLTSTGCVRRRTLTSYHTIQYDVRYAGGNWVDQEVVRDKNWVTSGQPSDIPRSIAPCLSSSRKRRKAWRKEHARLPEGVPRTGNSRLVRLSALAVTVCRYSCNFTAGAMSTKLRT